MDTEYFCDVCGGTCTITTDALAEPPVDCPWGCVGVDWRSAKAEDRRSDAALDAYEERLRERGKRI